MFLRIDLRPSAYLAAIHWLFHLSAVAALLFTSVHIGIRLSLALAILVSVLWSRLFNTVPLAIIFTETSAFLINSNRTVECILESECHCAESLQVLIFREQKCADEVGDEVTPGVRFCVIIAPDSASAHSRRHLRVLLRWHHFPGEMLRR